MDSLTVRDAKTPWRSEEWRSWAACKNVDTSIFFDHFPERAQSLCDVCPVDLECLDYALRERINHGVWGGKTESQRDQLSRRQRKELTEMLHDLGFVFEDMAFEFADKM